MKSLGGRVNALDQQADQVSELLHAMSGLVDPKPRLAAH
jgi:hypothetical protein